MTLIEKCNKVLETNWREKFTIPSPRLYPFQWNWDSGFIAIGNNHTNIEHSLLEMETLFSGQWANGFLPHILFHNEKKYTSYFPSADYWNSQLSPDAPKTLKTSGITQPPVHGFVLEELYSHNIDKDRITILFNQIVKYHSHLYKYREYQDTGLTAIWHNWESGMDNSVWWDSVLNRIPEEHVKEIELHRKDTQEVNESSETRPRDLDYRRYLYLVNELKKIKFEKVNKDYPFQVLDPVFNSILIKSNKSLIKIGKELGIDTSFLQQKNETAIKNFNKYFWNELNKLFYPFDIVVNKQIKIQCSGSFVPIFAEIPSLNQNNQLLLHLNIFDSTIPIPSCSPNETGFQQKNYWRGPVWVNINWMVWKGLVNYGLIEEAESLRNSTIQLVEKYGLYEYFDPYKNSNTTAGYGGANFSWTAALIIDMLRSETV